MFKRPFAHLFQHAYVTTDLDRTKEIFAQDWGVKNYFDMQPTLPVLTPRGSEQAELRIALAYVGELQIELIQPIGGAGARIYQEPLPAAGFSVIWHHFAFLVPGPVSAWQEFRAGIGNQTYPIAIEGDLGAVKFAYLDTRARLGHYCEYIWFEQLNDDHVPRN